MKSLEPGERSCVPKAVLLLRLARAMNLGRVGAVREARARLQSGKVRLTLISRGRAAVDLELWAIEKNADYFREVFGRELSTAVS